MMIDYYFIGQVSTFETCRNLEGVGQYQFFSSSDFQILLKLFQVLLNTGSTGIEWNIRLNRSSHPEVFCKKGALKNFSKFTEKHLCQILFFNKVAGHGFL